MSSISDPHVLGSKPIGKLLLEYSLPAIIGMTVTSLYNIIDSIFIGHGVGALAISALAVTFPLMNLLIAFCTLVGVGGATICSIRLGQKDKDGAEHILGNVTILSLIISVLFAGFNLIFLDDILTLFGASSDTLPYARDFMKIILLGCPISYIMIGLSNVMRATGYPTKAMLTQVLSVVCNIIFAPIFIFWLEWGMHGAAIATVLSQVVGMSWVLWHFFDNKSYIRFRKECFKLRKRIAKNILSIGMSPFFMNVCACLIAIFINNRLLTFGGDYYVGAFGIVNRMQMLFVMVVLGIAQGMQPIVGYNFGAGNIQRVRNSLKYGIAAGVSVTSFGCLCGLFIPELLVKMFTDDPQMIDKSVDALTISLLMFPVVGAQIVITQYFQSIGKAVSAIFLSLSRQLLFFLPGLIFLPNFFGVKGVWFSMPVSDFMAFVIATVLLILQFKKIGKENEK